MQFIVVVAMWTEDFLALNCLRRQAVAVDRDIILTLTWSDKLIGKPQLVQVVLVLFLVSL